MVSGNRVALKLVHDSIPSGRWLDVDSPRRGRIAGPAGFGQGSAGAPGWEWLVDKRRTASPAPAASSPAPPASSSGNNGGSSGSAPDSGRAVRRGGERVDRVAQPTTTAN